MNTVVLLFATVGLLNGVKAEPDPGCIPMQNCTREIYPGPREICVQVATGTTECWDACDHTHSLDQYAGVDADPNERQAIAMMVQAARTVQNLCPGEEWRVGECNLGQRCTAYTLYRGICSVLTTGNTSMHQCLDMCDGSIPLTSYGSGSGEKAGITRLVELVRAGRDPNGETVCPGSTVWLWLWFPILLCCLIGCCYGAYVSYNHWRRVNKRASRMNQMDQEYGDISTGNYQGFNDGFPDQEMPNQDYMPVNQDMEMMQQRDDMQNRDLQMPKEEEPMPVLAPEPPAPVGGGQERGFEAPVPQMPPQTQMPTQMAPQTQYAAPQPVSTAFAPMQPGGIQMAAPSTFYNSQQITTGYPQAMVGMGGSVYSTQGAMYQPGRMQPATASYRMA